MNRYMRDYVDSCHKESERYEVYSEQITSHFKNISNIIVDGEV